MIDARNWQVCNWGQNTSAKSPLPDVLCSCTDLGTRAGPAPASGAPAGEPCGRPAQISTLCSASHPLPVAQPHAVLFPLPAQDPGRKVVVLFSLNPWCCSMALALPFCLLLKTALMIGLRKKGLVILWLTHKTTWGINSNHHTWFVINQEQ